MMLRIVFFILLLSNCDAKRRGGGGRSRTGSSSDSDSSSSPGKTILGIIFALLFWGGGIGWKIYQCYRQEQHHERMPQQMHNIPTNLLQTSAIHQIIEGNSTNMSQFAIVYLPVQSSEDGSEKLIERNQFDPLEVQSSNDLQLQPTEKDEKCSMIAPINIIEKPSFTSWNPYL